MKFTIFQESRIGGRKDNEDRCGYVYSRDALLMTLADGMGGHSHGEVASQIAVQSMIEAFQREAKPRLVDPFQFLQKSIAAAHYSLLEFARARALDDTPRTTCVACVVQDGIAHWAHVGDSRLYHLRGGRVEAQTKDHSRVQLLVSQGRIREEAAATHPDRNRVYNCLGSSQPPQLELSKKTPLQYGDSLLLCSDGLWGPLTPAHIAGAFLKSDALDAAPKLLEQAQLRAGPECDNLSAVAMTWTDTSSVTVAGEITTQTLELDAFTTQMENWRGEQSSMTDEEIERSIAEIRAAIRKQTPGKT